MTIHFKKSVLVSAVMLAGVASSPYLVAQSEPQPKSKVTSLALEEVVVTAQKREEDTQDVPISISSLSETDLERRGVVNAGDLISTLPSMSGFEPPGGRGSLSINMRGVSAGSPANLSVDPATGMYIDGVYIGKTMALALDVADLERVEVLRGPQGTLYGRNSTGGAVNFITKKPTGEFGGKFSSELGSDSLWGVKGTVYTDTLGTVGEGLGALSGSFGAMTRQRDTLYNNTNKNFDDFEDLDRDAYRVALRWEPTDSTTVDYAFDYAELHDKGTPQFLEGYTPLAVNPQTGVKTSRTETIQNIYLGKIAPGLGQMNQYASVFGLTPDNTAGRYAGSSQDMLDTYNNHNDGNRPSRASSDTDITTDADTEGHTLTVGQAFDDLGVLQSVEFKSITAYRKMQNVSYGDLDGMDNSVAPGGSGAVNDGTLGILSQMYGEELSTFKAITEDPTNAALRQQYADVQKSTGQMWDYVDQWGAGFYIQNAHTKYDQFSQELQMVGTADNIDYALGLYYFEDDGKFHSTKSGSQPIGGQIGTGYENGTDAWAVYGQTTYRPETFDDKLALTLGYRYTEEKKDIKYLYESGGYVIYPGPNPGTWRTNPNYTGQLQPVPGQYDYNNDSQFSNDSGNVTVAYDVADSTNVYVRYATGYRSGGYNGELFNNLFEEETIDEWELGAKSDVVPGVLRLNGALFTYTYDDQQVSQIATDPNGNISSYIGNAGKSERWGGEVEAQWLPTDDVMVSLTYSYIHGNFEEYGELQGKTTTINTSDLAKRASPDNMASGIVDWVFARTDWAEFIAHTEVFYQSDSFASALWSGTYSGEPYVFDDIVLKDRTIVNLRLGMEGMALGDGTLRAGLWAKNLTDEDYNTFGVNFGGQSGPITGQYGVGASYGVDVAYEF